jgi:ABC-type sugar transport system ATPase subunit
MKFEIKSNVRRMGTTAVYATHDQAEAVVISDRIAVMDSGNVGQLVMAQEIFLSLNPQKCVILFC